LIGTYKRETQYIKNLTGFAGSYTDKKENQIFPIYMEIQSGAVASQI
jgi:hypothetical protein